MQDNAQGFLAPVIKPEICIKCGLCQQVCPVTSPSYCLNLPKTVFSATLKSSSEELKKSSSGGLAHALAKAMIEQHGVVFGAAYGSNLKVVHQEVSSFTELYALQGSKYVQSDLNTTYQKVKKRLQDNISVLFVGTPCQVAGLYSYLGKVPQERLLTCDLLCGGVPSPKLFSYYISYLETKYHHKITHFNFRSKKYGYGYLHCMITMPGHKPVLLTGIDASFIRTLGLGYVRQSCFHCLFRSMHRVADLTAGDFWNLPVPLEQFERGLSLGLINTAKGANFINKFIQSNVQYNIQTIQNVEASQSVSIKPIKKKPKDYDEFFSQAWKIPWPELSQKYIWKKSSFKQNLLDSLPPCVTSVIRRNLLRAKLWCNQKGK